MGQSLKALNCPKCSINFRLCNSISTVCARTMEGDVFALAPSKSRHEALFTLWVPHVALVNAAEAPTHFWSLLWSTPIILPRPRRTSESTGVSVPESGHR